METPSAPATTTTATATQDYWEHFRPFASRFEQKSYQRWYLYAIALLLIVTLANVGFDISNAMRDGISLTTYYRSDFIASNLGNLYNYWWFPLWLLVLTATAIPFLRWVAHIPFVFQQVLDRTQAATGRQESDLAALQRFQRRLLSPWRYVLAASMIVLAVAFFITLARSGDPNYIFEPVASKRSLLNDGSSVVVILILLVITYLVAIAVWMTYQTARWIVEVVQTRALIVQPNHPDESGGFLFLGDFFFELTLPILVVTGLAGVLDLSFLYGNTVPAYQIVIVVLLSIVLTIAVFFVPIFSVHRNMLRQLRAIAPHLRTEMGDDTFLRVRYADLLRAVEAQALVKAKQLQDEMDAYSTFADQEDHYPTWPFDRRILLRLATPQLLTIAVLVFNLLTQQQRYTAPTLDHLFPRPIPLTPHISADAALQLGDCSDPTSFLRLNDLGNDGIIDIPATTRFFGLTAACTSSGNVLLRQASPDDVGIAQGRLSDDATYSPEDFAPPAGIVAEIDFQFRQKGSCVALDLVAQYTFALCDDGTWAMSETFFHGPISFSEGANDDSTVILAQGTEPGTFGTGVPLSMQAVVHGTALAFHVGNNPIHQVTAISDAVDSEDNNVLATQIIVETKPEIVDRFAKGTFTAVIEMSNVQVGALAT